MASNDASNAIDSFQPLTKVIGTPSFKVIHARHKISKQNASSVITTLAGGNHGLLALIIGAAEYTQLTNAVWIEPMNPGLRPIIPANANRVAQENISSQWKNLFDSWKMVKDVREALKKQILEMVDDEFLEDLKDPDTGYANVTPLTMYEHLYTEYGALTPQDISENRNNLKADFNQSTTMISYFYNIREIQSVANRAGNPIPDSDLIAELYLVMDRAGIFAKAIDDWDDLPAVNQTWAQFQAHFKAAYKRHREKQRRQAAGNRPVENQANLAMETLATQMERHLSNYANAATVDRESLANLISANATLTATNAELTSKMNQCLIELAKMQKEIEKLQKSGGRNRNRNGNTNNNGNNDGNGNGNGSGNGTNTDNRQAPNPDGWKYYCWSCGLTNNRNHVSMNCSCPKPGHRRFATYERKFGGSEANC